MIGGVLVALLLIVSGYGFGQLACNVPPFLTTSVPPNILFVADVSGSMSWNAYYRNWFDPVIFFIFPDCPTTGRFTPCSSGEGFEEVGCYDPNNTYEGYFVPDRFYTFDGTAWVETSGPESCTMTLESVYEPDVGKCYYYYSVTGICSGNKLNFVLMSRIDLLRWAMVGGRPEGCNDGDFTSWQCDPDLACTGNTCRLQMVGSTINYLDQPIVEVPKERVKGVIQELERGAVKPRLGIMFFSGIDIDPNPRREVYIGIRPEKVYIGDFPDGNLRTFPATDPCSSDPSKCPYTFLKRYLNAVPMEGGTTTAPAMWEAYDYFKQSDDHNYANGFDINPGTYKDPQYICEDNNPNACQPVPCAKNFVILMSDGQWNMGGNPIEITCSIDKPDFEDYSADPVVPAYWMHTKTLRTMDLSGQACDPTRDQNCFEINVSAVYSLGLFLGGTGENSLKHVAIYGSFDNTNNTWPGGTSNYPFLSAIDSGSLCSTGIDDCTIYDDGIPDGDDKGSPCTPIPPSSPDWDRDGDGVPDTFLSAKNAIEIKRGLLTFITDILRRSSAASSVSILSRRGTKGNNVIQAVFYPQRSFPNDNKVDWVGYLYNYWFYFSPNEQSIREDTNQNKILDLDQDLKLDFRVDQAGNLKIVAKDNNDNPVTTYNSLDEVHPVWEAGEILKNTSPANRRIYTVSENDTLVEFTTANRLLFESLLGNTANFPACLSASGDPVDNLINFVRGEHIEGCRDRRADDLGNTWKLGDIVYSTPAILDYGDFGMVFVGANDGMLHAFRIGALRGDDLSANQVVRLCDELTGNCTTVSLGKEEWAFIPKNALPYLRYLADPSYVHRYFVDLPPYIIRLDTNGDGLPDRAILIGGMRLGGGCGCTDPTCENPPQDVCDLTTSPVNCLGLSSYFALDVTDPFNPEFLWEFTHPDLGFSYSGPAHITVGGKHFIMFVSGPTDLCGGSAQSLRIFVLEMDENFRIARRYIFTAQNDTPTLTAGYEVIPAQVLNNYSPNNQNQGNVVIGAFGGRLFTEGIDSNDDGETEMVFFGVNRNTGTQWQGNVIGVRITGPDPTQWEILQVFNQPTKPITAKIEYMKCFGMNYIFFGTGRWFFKDDEPGDINNPNDTERLYGVRIDGCLNGGNCSIQFAVSSNDACQELQSGSETFSWYVELAPRDADYFKERLISDPTVTNFDVVFFATTQPTGQLCGFGGRSRLWGLNCATGEGLLSTACPGFVAQVPPETTVLLQLSRGNIEQFGRTSFTEEGGRATEWQEGTTPESPPTVPGGGSVQGKVILWMER